VNKSRLEVKFQKILLFFGLKPPTRGCDKMFGRPDFVLKSKKTVIFIDGAFYHTKHMNHKKIASDSPLLCKIKKQIERDKKVTSYYKGKGWKIIRFAEEEINTCPEYVANECRMVL
jgi:DNA mismatch endonuclease (patch repair protein)